MGRPYYYFIFRGTRRKVYDGNTDRSSQLTQAIGINSWRVQESDSKYRELEHQRLVQGLWETWPSESLL